MKTKKVTYKESLGRMERYCRPLCEAINSLKGLYTFSSCNGHGVHPMGVLFTEDSG